MATSARKSKPSHAYASISVAIVMFLLGIFLLVFLHSHNLANLIKEKMNIVAELDKGANNENLVAQIQKLSGVRMESIQVIPSSKALITMGNNLEMEFDEATNPFRDVISFNLTAEAYSTETLEKLKKEVEAMKGVSGVYYEDLTIQNIKSNLNKVAYSIFFVGLIFVFLAVIIIRNTINLSMYADRWEIKTMELVGARWNFIKMPYIKTSVLIGFRAFLLAGVFLIALLGVVYFYLPRVWTIVNFMFILTTLLSMLILSIVIPAITTNDAASSYLSKNVDAMYD